MKQYKHIGVYALAIEGEKVLLIKKARGPYTGKWDLPGGGLEFGEKPRDGLARETLEETGLLIKKASLIDILSNTVIHELENGKKEQIYHLGIIYKVILKTPEDLKRDPDGEDSQGASWIELKGVSENSLSPFAYQIIETGLKKAL